MPARAEARRDLRQRLSRHGGPWLQGSKNSSRGNTTGPACIQRSDTDRRGSSRCKLKPKAEAIGKCVSSGQAMRQCTHRIVSTRGSPVQLSVRALPKLYQNCSKTPSDCDFEAYFEREADSPKLLETLKRLSEGRRCWNQGSCLQSKCSPS